MVSPTLSAISHCELRIDVWQLLDLVDHCYFSMRVLRNVLLSSSISLINQLRLSRKTSSMQHNSKFLNDTWWIFKTGTFYYSLEFQVANAPWKSRPCGQLFIVVDLVSNTSSQKIHIIWNNSSHFPLPEMIVAIFQDKYYLK